MFHVTMLSVVHSGAGNLRKGKFFKISFKVAMEKV
jgi:hypothetical protein